MQEIEMPYIIKEIKVLHCLRCGGEWLQRFPDREPKNCAICNSPSWNKPRVRKPRRK